MKNFFRTSYSLRTSSNEQAKLLPANDKTVSSRSTDHSQVQGNGGWCKQIVSKFSPKGNQQVGNESTPYTFENQNYHFNDQPKDTKRHFAEAPKEKEGKIPTTSSSSKKSTQQEEEKGSNKSTTHNKIGWTISGLSHEGTEKEEKKSLSQEDTYKNQNFDCFVNEGDETSPHSDDSAAPLLTEHVPSKNEEEKEKPKSFTSRLSPLLRKLAFRSQKDRLSFLTSSKSDHEEDQLLLGCDEPSHFKAGSLELFTSSPVSEENPSSSPVSEENPSSSPVSEENPSSSPVSKEDPFVDVELNDGSESAPENADDPFMEPEESGNHAHQTFPPNGIELLSGETITSEYSQPTSDDIFPAPIAGGRPAENSSFSACEKDEEPGSISSGDIHAKGISPQAPSSDEAQPRQEELKKEFLLRKEESIKEKDNPLSPPESDDLLTAEEKHSVTLLQDDLERLRQRQLTDEKRTSGKNEKPSETPQGDGTLTKITNWFKARIKPSENAYQPIPPKEDGGKHHGETASPETRTLKNSQPPPAKPFVSENRDQENTGLLTGKKKNFGVFSSEHAKLNLRDFIQKIVKSIKRSNQQHNTPQAGNHPDQHHVEQRKEEKKSGIHSENLRADKTRQSRDTSITPTRDKGDRQLYEVDPARVENQTRTASPDNCNRNEGASFALVPNEPPLTKASHQEQSMPLKHTAAPGISDIAGQVQFHVVRDKLPVEESQEEDMTFVQQERVPPLQSTEAEALLSISGNPASSETHGSASFSQDFQNTSINRTSALPEHPEALKAVPPPDKPLEPQLDNALPPTTTSSLAPALSASTDTPLQTAPVAAPTQSKRHLRSDIHTRPCAVTVDPSWTGALKVLPSGGKASLVGVNQLLNKFLIEQHAEFKMEFHFKKPSFFKRMLSSIRGGTPPEEQIVIRTTQQFTRKDVLHESPLQNALLSVFTQSVEKSDTFSIQLNDPVFFNMVLRNGTLEAKWDVRGERRYHSFQSSLLDPTGHPSVEQQLWLERQKRRSLPVRFFRALFGSHIPPNPMQTPNNGVSASSTTKERGKFRKNLEKPSDSNNPLELQIQEMLRAQPDPLPERVLSKVMFSVPEDKQRLWAHLQLSVSGASCPETFDSLNAKFCAFEKNLPAS